MSDAPSVRFRHNAAIALAGVAGLVAAIPLAGSRWYLAPLLLIPLLVAVWGWRSGVDVDSGGLTVRALAGTRRLSWREVTGFTTQRRRVYVLLANERAVPLPAVTPGDLPTLIEAGGQHLDAAGPPADTEPGTDAGPGGGDAQSRDARPGGAGQ